MIKRLELKDFGKFSGRDLHFGPFTLITGPNEAGKTTVFDALSEALCAGSRNESKSGWKRLAARYGAHRDCVLSWEKGFTPLSFDYTEFLEIFAIRGGEPSVTAANGKSWAAAAEARLLNAGLNPAQLASELTYKAETSSKGSAQANIKKLQRTIADIEAGLAEIKAKRDLIMAGDAELARLEAEKKAKDEVLAKAREALDALKKELAALEGACKLASALDGIKALRDLKAANDELAGLSLYAVNELPAYRALILERQNREKALGEAQAALKEQKIALDAAEAGLGQLFKREQTFKNQKARAASISAKLSAFASAPEVLTRSVDVKKRWGIWAGGLALACVVAYSGGNIGGYAVALVVAGAAAWVGLKLSVVETLTGHSQEEIKKFLAGLAVEWAKVSKEPLPAGSLEEARGSLARPAAEYATAHENLTAKAKEAADLKARYTVMAGQNLAEVKKAVETAEQNARKWLQDRGCAAEEDYQAKIDAYGKVAARLGDIEVRVGLFNDKYSCAGADELKDKLFTEKEAFELKGLDPEKADEPELERMQKRFAALTEEVHADERTVGELDTALKTARAAAGAKLEGLPERINRAETEIAAAKEEIAGLELQIGAYNLAALVFTRLAASSATAFAALGKDVSATLSAVLPQARAEFRAFDAGSASLKDAGGEMRNIEDLSSGTKDLFMLAARVTMARNARLDNKGRLSPALLVLDEPFHTLDQDRTRAAVKLLAAFQKETGWQIVILTKDPSVPGMAEDLNVTEIKLG